MTPAEAAKVVATLAAMYPNARLSTATVEGYELMLADLDFELARKAVGRLVCTSKFFPSIAEIRDAALEAVAGPVRSGADAWADVTMAIRRVGYCGEPKFADPIVAECVRVMSWRNLCIGETPEGVDRATFVKLYDERVRRQRADLVAEPGRLLPAGRAPEALPGKVMELTGKVGVGVQARRGRLPDW